MPLQRWLLLLALVPWVALAAEPAAQNVAEGKRLFEQYCGICHSLDLPRNQRLDRGNWEWVIEDMIKKFNCPITAEQGARVVDYLVTTHGPDS